MTDRMSQDASKLSIPIIVAVIAAAQVGLIFAWGAGISARMDSLSNRIDNAEHENGSQSDNISLDGGRLATLTARLDGLVHDFDRLEREVDQHWSFVQGRSNDDRSEALRREFTISPVGGRKAAGGP